MAVEKSLTIQENPSLSQTDLNAGCEFREYHDGAEAVRYVVSDAVNRHVRTDDIGLTALEDPYKTPERFEKYSKIMFEFHGEAEAGSAVMRQAGSEGAAKMDALTGSPSFHEFSNRVKKAVQDPGRAGVSYNIVYSNIDNMKLCNESFGLAAGEGENG